MSVFYPNHSRFRAYSIGNIVKYNCCYWKCISPSFWWRPSLNSKTWLKVNPGIEAAMSVYRERALAKRDSKIARTYQPKAQHFSHELQDIDDGNGGRITDPGDHPIPEIGTGLGAGGFY